MNHRRMYCTAGPAAPDTWATHVSRELSGTEAAALQGQGQGQAAAKFRDVEHEDYTVGGA